MIPSANELIGLYVSWEKDIANMSHDELVQTITQEILSFDPDKIGPNIYDERYFEYKIQCLRDMILVKISQNDPENLKKIALMGATINIFNKFLQDIKILVDKYSNTEDKNEEKSNHRRKKLDNAEINCEEDYDDIKNISIEESQSISIASQLSNSI